MCHAIPICCEVQFVTCIVMHVPHGSSQVSKSQLGLVSMTTPCPPKVCMASVIESTEIIHQICGDGVPN